MGALPPLTRCADPATPRRLRLAAAMALALLAAACASMPELDDGKRLLADGKYEEGLAKLQDASRRYPNNADVRNSYVMQREVIVGAFVRDADTRRNAGDLDGAEARYRRALALDPASSIVQAGLDTVVRERRLALRAKDAEAAFARGDTASAESIARAVLNENAGQRTARAVMRAIAERKTAPALEPPLKVDPLLKVTLEFREAPLQAVFELISRRAGINFVFDRDVRPDMRTSIVARDSPLEDVIKLLLVTNQLERKVISETSVLIYPNTPAKKRDYQETVVRTFYLANADPKQTAAMIRTLVKTRDLYVDDKLNMIVMKDTADAVRLAEQLVAAQDLGEPEVMLDLEVLEVASNVMQEFGVKYPDRVNFGLAGTQTSTSVINTNGQVVTLPNSTVTGTPPDIATLPPGPWNWFVANPGLVLNLRKLDGTVSLLANPRIRVKNRDKAKVHVGEKVPVITTTSTANVGVSSSVNYLETGLKLDVEPTVFLEDEVAIKMQLEVSNILEQLNVSGTISYRLGTRNAATTLRLHDGETQVLAGLINSEDRRNASKVPYLGDLPLLGRLFRTDTDSRSKTEIVLLITPHIVRNLQRPDTVSASYPSGTDASPGTAALRLGSASPTIGMVGAAGGGVGVAPRPQGPASGPAPRQAANERGGAPESVMLNVLGPQQANVGQEFAVSLRFGPEVQQSANAYIDVTYDASVLALAGGAGRAGAAGEPGRTRVNVVATGIGGIEPTAGEVRFKVLAKERTSTEIGIRVGSAVDFNGRPVNVVAPPSHTIEIVP